MISYSKELACRRELLITCCAAQRNALIGQGQALKKKLSAFDAALTAFEGLKKNPAWAAGLVAALIVIKPRRLLTVLQTGLLAWQALRISSEL
jgi:hypothetical protein